MTVGVISAAVSGCDRLSFDPQNGWEIYRNPRYGFEFPYPKAWVAEPPPDNLDGQVFRAPDRPGVEISGWASQIPDDISDDARESPAATVSPNPVEQNFVTEQGLSGELEVQIASEISSLNLTLVQDGVVYRWQGRSPSDRFEDYYKFFSYVASQYQVLPAVE